MERIAIKSPNFNELGLYEYLLVANPNSEVNSKVLAEKNQFAEYYKHRTVSKTQSHITIASFLAREVMEETIIRYTQRVCSQQASFNVELNNYSGFPPHTIYLRIQNPQPFKHLTKELKVISNYINSCSCPPVQFKTNPHLTIAQRIPQSIFDRVLMEYSQKSFYENFMVNELVLLRRSSQYDATKKVQVFHLQPPGYSPVTNTSFN